ncbi:MAG: DUF881 domain-containing protein [Bacillota bacterium]|nr:DUF881 domain-containing protein [Bacillota bacterium]
MKINKNIALTFVCIILGLVITWQLASINHNQTIASSENKRSDDLMQQLLAEKKTNDDLRQRNSELEQLKSKYESSKGDDNKMIENLKNELQRDQMIAGLIDVKGKGVVVTLENNENSTILDTDILKLVNELKASDAQAISVNDERITAMSEIRSAGIVRGYIMVNGKQMVAPFTIKAIADPDKLDRALEMIGGQVEELEQYQLKVTVKKSDNIVIPRVRDDGTVIRTDLLTPVEQK